jgi:DNA-binding beta-propeller fold protein YncE
MIQTLMPAGWPRPLLVLAALGLAPACDDDPPDNEPPALDVLFPAHTSAVESPTVIVRGTTTDASGVTAVRVNGMPATTTDDFASWRIELALEPGANAVAVEAEDVRGQLSDTVTLSVFRSEMLRLRADAMAVDESAGRALVIDAVQGDLVSVDLSTGVRQVLSPGTPREFGQLGGFSDMLLDRAQNRVVALDKDEGTVVAIDLDTGVRTALSDASTDAEVPLMMPQAMAMDPATGRLLVLDQGPGALLAVDLETGDRTMLSDNATGAGPEIGFAFDVDIDAARNRALVIATNDTLLAIDLASGDRTVIADAVTGSGPVLEFPTAVLVHAAGNRALVRDQEADTIVAVDLETGERTVAVPSGFYSFGDRNSIALDAAGARIFTNETGSNGLQVVDLATGAREIVAAISVGTGVQLGQFVHNFQFDLARSRVLAFEASSIMAFDLLTGERTYIQPGSDQTPALSDPIFLAIDEASHRAVVLDGAPPELVRAAGRDVRAVTPDVTVSRPALLSIDLENLTCELVAGLTWEPSYALFDRERQRVLLFRGIDDMPLQLSAFALETGAEERYVQAAATLSELAYSRPAMDTTRERLLLFKEEQGLMGTDLVSGEIEVISDAAAHPDLVPVPWSTIIVDVSRDRALMHDQAQDVLIAIDLETGAREIVYERDPAAGLAPEGLTGLALDEVHNRGVLLDGRRSAVVLMDFETGMSAVVSM